MFPSVDIDEEVLSGEGKGKESNGSEKVNPVCEVPCRRMIVDLPRLVSSASSEMI